jgi:hypothetical protein
MSSGPLSAYNTPNLPPTNPVVPEEDTATLGASGSGGAETPSEIVASQYIKGHPLFDDLAPEDSYQEGIYWVRVASFLGVSSQPRRICPIAIGRNG